MSHWIHDLATGRHVRFAPDREARPNDLSQSATPTGCPFCAPPGERTPPELDRVENPSGEWLARVVPNRYPAFDGDAGACEVVIESPNHESRFAELSDQHAEAAVSLWARRIETLSQGSPFQLFFKNEGAKAGASLSHVHSQLVALGTPPEGWAKLWGGRVDWREGRLERSICESQSLCVFAPAAPRFPGETWIAPPKPGVRFSHIENDRGAAADLAQTLRRLLRALRTLGVEDFNLVLMQPDRESRRHTGDDWRLEVVPRTSEIAGFELATGAYINTLPPEQAAERLRLALARTDGAS